jgi:hypothetical protein
MFIQVVIVGLTEQNQSANVLGSEALPCDVVEVPTQGRLDMLVGRTRTGESPQYDILHFALVQ